MARLVHFDASAGASGDMVLGALLDLGLPLDALREELARLPLGGYRLEARAVTRAGLRATKLDVVLERPDKRHRGLAEIRGLLAGGRLSAPVRERAERLFLRLAEAEAEAHGVSPEQVHFHEVGAVDSIVDIVGSVIGLERLEAAAFSCSEINLGGGSAAMAHGTVAVPAPATARLVRGAPVFGEGDFERLTPTGALLLTEYATRFGPLPPLRLLATGCGAGTRDSPGRANVLRLLVGEADAPEGERLLVLECEVDDLSPQLLPPLLERLLAAGALDAFLTPIHMKKGRPGILISVLAEGGRREALEEILFAETTTLGVRRQQWERTALERESVVVETPYGRVSVKVGRRGGKVVNAQPEFDDCRRLAEQSRVPVKEVWAAALQAWRAGRPS